MTIARRRHGWLAFGLAVCLTAAAVASYFVFDRSRILRIDPNDVTQVEVGRRVYAEACASCHGASLEGQPNWQRRMPTGRLPAPPHDASGHTWHHSDEQLFAITKFGTAALVGNGYESDMIGFGDTLGDDEIRAKLLAEIKNMHVDEIRNRRVSLVVEMFEKITPRHSITASDDPITNASDQPIVLA